MNARLARGLWLCPVVSLALAVAVLVALGITWWTALIVAMVLACPVAVVWSLVAQRLSRREIECCHPDAASARPRKPRSWIRSRSGVALLVFLAIAGFFLLTEHTAHAFGALPYLLLLACPLMHFFHGGHRRGHGGHGGPPSSSRGDVS